MEENRSPFIHMQMRQRPIVVQRLDLCRDLIHLVATHFASTLDPSGRFMLKQKARVLVNIYFQVALKHFRFAVIGADCGGINGNWNPNQISIPCVQSRCRDGLLGITSFPFALYLC